MEIASTPTVSVVMPAYNAEKYLREAIDSILSQTYTDFELIIINDGSKDSTKEIILSYTDPRIVYIENEQNSGICVTLNKGLEAARGRYIARMDSDDISMPERLELQVKYMDEKPEIGASGTDIVIFGDNIEDNVFEHVHNPEQCSAGLLFNPCFSHPSVIIRREILESYNIRYEDRYRGLEDFKIWWDIAKHSRLSNLNYALLKYRHHTNQETQNVKPATREKSNEFRTIRYESFGLSLTSKEKQLVNDYSYGNFNKFGMPEFYDFLNVLSKICKAHKFAIITNRYSVKLVCGKAIAYTIKNSPELRERTLLLLTKSYVKGAMPLKWYLKYFISNFI
ncbi:MAG: glycosyltransferase [Muribaculaceae bacterium]|nr:glycosyltransferase [Muribaculaceae bacterium]